MSKKYPKEIFVQIQGESNDEYLQAETKIEEVPDDGIVAVYKLVGTKTRKTEVKIF